MSRLAWGHESRHCCVCGKVGPRIQTAFGWTHKYCMSAPGRREHNKRMKAGEIGKAMKGAQ